MPGTVRGLVLPPDGRTLDATARRVTQGVSRANARRHRRLAGASVAHRKEVGQGTSAKCEAFRTSAHTVPGANGLRVALRAKRVYSATANRKEESCGAEIEKRRGALSAAASGASTPEGGRAYELVSPVDKGGGAVAVDSHRTRASTDGDAIGFISLAAFGDASGTGVATDYVSQRLDGPPAPGEPQNGWATHGVTPNQAPGTLTTLLSTLEPLYVGEFSDDLQRGVFYARSPVTADDNVANVLNLYRRSDLRTPGAGFYDLVTRCPLCEATTTPLPPFPDAGTALEMRPWLVGASPDFERVVFESLQRLTADTPDVDEQARLYEWDGSDVRLVGRAPVAPAVECDDVDGPACEPLDLSVGGAGAGSSHPVSRTPHVVSDGSDGHSRIIFTRASNGSGSRTDADGYSGYLYMRVDGRTTIQVNASERMTPAFASAEFADASADGTRVFFTTTGALTDDVTPGARKLYMYDLHGRRDEQQRLTVAATGGSYTITFGADTTAPIAFDAPAGAVQAALEALPSIGVGDVEVSGGVGDALGRSSYLISFGGALGQTDLDLLSTDAAGLSGGVAATDVNGLTVAATGGTYTLTFNAETTAPIAFDAHRNTVDAALEALTGIGAGEVRVTGGVGDATGSSPYNITFSGTLAGQDASRLVPDSSGLTGGAAVPAPWTRGGGRLTVLNVDEEPADGVGGGAQGVIGASDDGRYVYMIVGGQLVRGAPTLGNLPGIYLWRDGEIAYIGRAPLAGPAQNELLVSGPNYLGEPRQARVTPDGRHLLFSAIDGTGLTGDDHGSCTTSLGTGCRQLYLYSADTSELTCVSCPPSGPATAMATTVVRTFTGGTQTSWHETTALAADGSRVFFSTADPLADGDTNRRIDAYEYDVATGTQRLLSTGTSSDDSWFMDASADGDDAFFVTREQLVGWDRDGNYDLYDARVGGGFPEPVAAQSCSGDGCQGALGVPPALLPSASSVFKGSGNVAESRTRPRGTRRKKAKRCKRGFVKKRVRTKRGKVKRKCISKRRAAKRAKQLRAAKRAKRASAQERRGS